ncbi:hypothetical protein Tco_1569350 [Tanacetum coccineum]
MEQMTTICDMIPICYDNDDDDTIAITPVLSTEEPVNSLSMGDEHLDTIPETELDEFIKSCSRYPFPTKKLTPLIILFPNLKLRFNLEEISSGSTTTRSDLSLPDCKAFYVDNDHFKEKSSGSTTTHVDFSRYDSFSFDLSNDSVFCDRSDLL